MNLKEWKSDTGIVIGIDHDNCVAHGECVEMCPAMVFVLVDEKATAPNVEDCVECCACLVSCPTGAISHSSCNDQKG